MKWLKKLSALHVRAATLLEKMSQMNEEIRGLSSDIVDIDRRVARMEGAVANSTNSELVRQVNELSAKVAVLSARIDLDGDGIVPKFPELESSETKNIPRFDK